MDLRICILLAICTASFGLALRAVIPVTPVDAPFQEIVRYYDSLLSQEHPSKHGPGPHQQ